METDPLRAEAEARILNVEPGKSVNLAGDLLHDLQVHQIELEMQNETLRQTRIALEESRDRFADLYDFAPVGYLTLSEAGLISEINLAGAKLLGADRQALRQEGFARFVAAVDARRWERFFLEMLQDEEKHRVELSLRREDASLLDAQLDCRCVKNGDAPPSVLVTLTEISELRQAVSALAQIQEREKSEKKFMQLFMEVPVAMGLADAAGVISYFNKKFTDTFGYTVEDVTTLNEWWLKAYPDQAYRNWVLSNWNEAVARAIQAGTDVESAEYKVTCKSGAVRIVTISGHLFEGGVLALFNDITERKRADAKLRENEERLRLALAASKQAWFDVNVQTGEVNVSPEYPAMIGYAPDSFHTSLQNWIDSLHPDDRSFVLDAVQNCKVTGGPTAIQYRRSTCSGGWLWIHSIARVEEWDEANRPLRIIGIHRDISERKQAELALKKSEEAFRLLFESSRDALMTSSIGAGFLSGNPAAIALFGCKSEQEFMALSPAMVSPEFQPDGRRSDEKAREMMQVAVDSGSNFFEWTHKRVDGTVFYADVLLTRLEIDGKTLIQATVRDITERKLAQVKLTEQLDELKRWQAITLGREDRILTLKREVNELLGQAGKSPRYPSAINEP